MPIFRVYVLNSDFDAFEDVRARDVEDAAHQGLRAALGIGTDELCKGKQFFGAEVRVEVDGEVRSRAMVAIGQSPLVRTAA